MSGTRLRVQIACFAFFCAGVQAQTTATILGTVQDSSGAPVPNATITATNLGTNVARKQSTAQDGSYSLTFLPLETYKVEIDSAGFKKFEQTGIMPITDPRDKFLTFVPGARSQIVPTAPLGLLFPGTPASDGHRSYLDLHIREGHDRGGDAAGPTGVAPDVLSSARMKGRLPRLACSRRRNRGRDQASG